MGLFKNILIANRGEIAVRIMRTARQMGISTTPVYARVDTDSLHVQYADIAYCIGEVELADTYLNVDKIISIARKAGCDAIHPGYGFLSENPKLVAACQKNGITFIGPSTRAIQLMGNKIEARAFVKSIDIPLTEGITGDKDTLLKESSKIPFPILVKAASGGGGKGMRIVKNPDQLEEVLEATSREAQAYFGDGAVYIEQFIEDPRHIEIQILADNHGNVVHLYERECSIQRRYQKIIEEAPSPTINNETRRSMGEAAVRIAREIEYTSAGTLEFLLDKNENFYFLEMNTRIQVEHPVTELTTGYDIVAEQIKIAANQVLSIQQEKVIQQGHAIECRIYAESPARGFLPSPGKMTLYREPKGADIRIDSGLTPNTEIKSFYDPMVAKLIIHAENRNSAIKASRHALAEFAVQGVETNIQYLDTMLKSDAFVSNSISTRYCDEHSDELIKQMEDHKASIAPRIPACAALVFSFAEQKLSRPSQHHDIWNQIGHWRHVVRIPVKVDDTVHQLKVHFVEHGNYQVTTGNQTSQVEVLNYHEGKLVFAVDDKHYEAFVSEDSRRVIYVNLNLANFTCRREDILSDKDYVDSSIVAESAGGNTLQAPMPGKVIQINVNEGDTVQQGDTLVVLEAMKMENSLAAPANAKVKRVHVAEADMVNRDDVLVELEFEEQ